MSKINRATNKGKDKVHRFAMFQQISKKRFPRESSYWWRF